MSAASFSSGAALSIGPTDAVVPALDGVAADALDTSYSACGDITRRAAKNFFYGLRLTPEPRRSAVYSIYAWMRQADDQVDDAGTIQEKRQRLEAFRLRTMRALSGDLPQSPSEPFWPAFAATLRSYPVDRAHIESMLDGLAEDLDHSGYSNWDDLDRYCYRVGSTVGLVCIAIWGLRPHQDTALAHARAVARGRAFQITNILRDVAHDFDDSPRRVYLPESLLQAHGLTPEELRAWAKPDACRNLILQAAARARGFYEQSSGLEAVVDRQCAPALWGMTRIYAGILDLIEKDPSRVVADARVRLSTAQKGLIALTAVVRQRSGAWV